MSCTTVSWPGAGPHRWHHATPARRSSRSSPGRRPNTAALRMAELPMPPATALWTEGGDHRSNPLKEGNTDWYWLPSRSSVWSSAGDRRAGRIVGCYGSCRIRRPVTGLTAPKPSTTTGPDTAHGARYETPHGRLCPIYEDNLEKGGADNVFPVLKETKIPQ